MDNEHRLFLSSYNDDYKVVKDGNFTEESLSNLMDKYYYGGSLFDLNVGDYALNSNGDICHITSSYIETQAWSYGYSRNGFISNVIKYDEYEEIIKYDIGYDITEQAYKHKIINYPKIVEIIPKESNVKYLFSLLDEIYDYYLRISVTGLNHKYVYTVDSDMFNALTIRKDEWSEFLNNKIYDNCIDYIISKDSSRFDKLCNITKNLYDFISDKMLSYLRPDYANNRDNYYIPICIDNKKPYNIIFEIIEKKLKKSKSLDTVSIYIGDLLNQNLKIVDYNKECYIKYKECIYSNVEKIFYLYGKIANKAI